MSIPTPFVPAPDPNEELKKRIANTKDHVKQVPLSNVIPLKAKLPKSEGKPVPTVFKHIIKIEYFRRFSFRERIAILFGSGIVLQIGCATQHSPGVFQPLILGKVTKETSPDSYMRKICDDMIEERGPDSPIKHEPVKQSPETL